MESKVQCHRRESHQCYREMLNRVHALGACKVEGTVPGTEEHIVLNGNPGVSPQRKSDVFAFMTVSQEAESLVRSAQRLFLGGRMVAPVTLTWQPGAQPVTL